MLRNAPATIPRAMVHCEKCNRQVDSFAVETPVRLVAYGEETEFNVWGHTGEIIVTVECHGERWTMSNRPGHWD